GLGAAGAKGMRLTLVGGHGQRPGARVAGPGDHPLEGVLATPGERDVIALSPQREPDGPADSAPGARHDRDFLVHIDLLMALMVDAADSTTDAAIFPGGPAPARTSTIRSTGGAAGRIIGPVSGSGRIRWAGSYTRRQCPTCSIPTTTATTSARTARRWSRR